MQAKDLIITKEALTGGGRIIATKIAPDYDFKDGVRDTTKLIGQRVTVVFPGNGYAEQVVRVANTVDTLSALLEKATPDNPLYVDFVNFSASIYSMRGNDSRWAIGVSAKATDVKPIVDIVDDGSVHLLDD